MGKCRLGHAHCDIYLRVDGDGDSDDAKSVSDHGEDVVAELLLGPQCVKTGFRHDGAAHFQVRKCLKSAGLVLRRKLSMSNLTGGNFCTKDEICLDMPKKSQRGSQKLILAIQASIWLDLFDNALFITT